MRACVGRRRLGSHERSVLTAGGGSPAQTGGTPRRTSAAQRNDCRGQGAIGSPSTGGIETAQTTLGPPRPELLPARCQLDHAPSPRPRARPFRRSGRGPVEGQSVVRLKDQLRTSPFRPSVDAHGRRRTDLAARTKRLSTAQPFLALGAAGVGFEPTIEVDPRCRFSRLRWMPMGHVPKIGGDSGPVS